MTVSYSSSVATVRYGSLIRLLLRWRGSLYKAVWAPVLIFSTIYGIISITYYVLPSATEEQQAVKRRIVQVCMYAGRVSGGIPVSFVLGFFVSIVVGRWWQQFINLPTPDAVCILVAAYLENTKHPRYGHAKPRDAERSMLYRRAIARYLNLSCALFFHNVSMSMKRQLNNLDEFVLCGLMTKQEQVIYTDLSQDNGYFFIPLVWAITLVTRAHNEGRIRFERHMDSIVSEIVMFWQRLHNLFIHDYCNVPLVYNQVVTLAVYLYLGTLTLSEQFADPLRILREYEAQKQSLQSKVISNVSMTTMNLINGTSDILNNTQASALDVIPNIPVFGLLSLVFYTGWLRVAESSIFPFADDDDDFEIVPLMERNIHASFWLVDGREGGSIEFPEVAKNAGKLATISDLGDDTTSTAGLTDYVKDCLLAAVTHDAMGWKRNLDQAGDQSGSESMNPETLELPCPSQLRRRSSRYFFAGSQNRLVDERLRSNASGLGNHSRQSSFSGSSIPSTIVDHHENIRRPSILSPFYGMVERVGARLSQVVLRRPFSSANTIVEDALGSVRDSNHLTDSRTNMTHSNLSVYPN